MEFGIYARELVKVRCLTFGSDAYFIPQGFGFV